MGGVTISRTAATAANEYTITAHDPMRDTDEEIAERVEFSNAIQREIHPDDPPTPVEETIASIRATPERIRRWSFRARDADGVLVGAASTGLDPEHDENPDLLQINVTVAAGHRERGLGTRLFAHMVQLAEELGRTRLIGATNDRLAAGEAFATKVGADVKSRMHTNRLLVADIDRAELERWAAEGPVRADGYELIGWDGPVPEEHLDAYVDLVHVMNSAPRDDLEINDFVLTAEQVREGEKQAAAIGVEEWTLVARRTSDGAFAGFHDMSWVPWEPTNMYVGATGVLPEHRGHALGKWLKAAMQLRVLDERPDVDQVRTGNADSNDAMLGINHAMGYRPWIAQAIWELSTADARAYAESRGAL